jgi:hypothetical protein
MKFAIDVWLDKLAFVIVHDHAGVRPMRDVPLDVPDHRGNVDLLEEDAFDLNKSAVLRSRLGFALKDFDGDILSILMGIDVFAGQLDAGESPVFDSRNAQDVGDAECCGLARAEISASRTALLAIEVLAMHLKILLKVADEHPAAIVPDLNRLGLNVDFDNDCRLGRWVFVLKTVRDVFPYDRMLVAKQLGALEEVSPDMARTYLKIAGRSRSAITIG